VKALDHNRPDIGLARASAIARSEPHVCSRRVTGVTVVGVRLSREEEMGARVTMDAVVSRIDPTATNPYVQANVAHGFPMGFVQITRNEYEAAVGLI
jgi:hypothetical protein